ncbi:hypothetical protein [Salinisphaera sp. PC39]|uniref:hypothetical protein n=1 Tax=Salinisphaera sp. PC39 TaxID=1304156 RepID=UPI00333E4709
MNSILRLFPVALILLAVAGCDSSSGGDDDIISGGGSSNSGGDFDLDSATLVLDGPSGIAPGSTANFTATLLDEDDLPPPAPGVFIDVQPTAGQIVPEGGGNTDGDGVLNFSYIAPGGNFNGTITITATVTQDDQTITDTIPVTVQSNVFRFTAPLENANVRVGENTEVRFQWTVGGQGVTIDDELPYSTEKAKPIQLEVTGGGGGGKLSANGSAPTAVVSIATNDGSFAGTVELTSDTMGGEATLTASANGQTATLPILFVGEPQSVEVSVSETSVPARGFTLITANVRDEAGNDLTGIPLEFGISRCAGGGISPCGDGEEVLPVDRTTNADGKATSSYFASSDKGSAQVSATVSGGPGAGVDGFASLEVVNAD